MKRVLLLIFCLLLTGCYRNNLLVIQRKVTPDYLASTHIGSPDPRRENPPCGQLLAVFWDFPSGNFCRGTHLVVTVRFWNNTEKVYKKYLAQRKGHFDLYFPHLSHEEEKKILTYKAEVFSGTGKLISSWKHHFWIKLIHLQPGQDEGKKTPVEDVLSR